MTEIKSISVSPEFSQLAKDHGISWSEAARVGMSLLLADKDVMPYDNKINLYRKMQIFRQQAEDALQKLAGVESHEK